MFFSVRDQIQISKQLVLQPGEQKARFIDEEEFFKEYLEANPGDFSGTLNIAVESGEDVALVGLIQKRGNNPALLTRISHQLAAASPDASALTALRSVGPLDGLSSTTAGASVARLVRTAPPLPRYATW